MRFTICSAICLLLLSLHRTSADGNLLRPMQSPELAKPAWSVRDLSDQAGLHRKQIRAGAFEPDGTIWLGAADGAYRYDGYGYVRFGIEDGLPGDFVGGLLFDRHGTLWISTQKGAAKFDPVAERFVPVNGLERLSLGAIREDDDGTIWFCGKDCGLISCNDGLLHFYGEEDGLPSLEVNDYFQDSQSRRYALTTKGLVQLEGDHWISPLAESGLGGETDQFRTAVESPALGVLFTTDRAIYRLQDEKWSSVATDRAYQLFLDSDDTVLAIGPVRHWADSNFAFYRWNGAEFSQESPEFRLSKNWSFWHGTSPDGSVWMTSYNRLIRWGRQCDEWERFNVDLRPQFQDLQGRIWFSGQATAAVLDGNDWYQLDTVSWPMLDREGTVWFHSPAGVPDGLTSVTGDQVTRIPVQETGLGQSHFIVVDGTGVIWNVGADHDLSAAVSNQEEGGWEVRNFGSNPQVIHAASGDPHGGIWLVLVDAESSNFLEVVGIIDGMLLETPKLPSFPVETPSKDQLKLLCDDSHRLWLKHFDRMFLLRIGVDDQWEDVTSQIGALVYGWSPQASKTWFALSGLAGGRSGLVSYEDGKWEFFEGNEPSWFDRWGLPSSVIGFDSQFVSLAQGRPQSVSLPFEDTAYNGIIDDQGTAWLSVRDGLLRYRADGIPPVTRFSFGDRRAEKGEVFRFGLEATSRFQSNVSGGFQFQRKIDDQAWSQPSSLAELQNVAADALGPGPHRIVFRAIDEAGDVEVTPQYVSVQVLNPIWKRPGFVSLIAALTAIAGLQTARVVQRGRRIRVTELELKKQDLLREVNQMLEHKVQERTEALKDSNDELKAFAHTVSHDLRAPLRAMEGFALALSEDYGRVLDQQASEYLSNIVASANRMDELVNDLLAYSRLGREELKLAEISLRDVVAAAQQNLESDIEQCKAVIHVADGLHHVIGHRATIVQILQNLISNGLKFVEQGVVPELWIESAECPGNRIRLSVADNGIGIDAKHHERIFSVFERLHGIESYQGTGIGLAIVHRACQRLGGRCGVEANAGGGTRFWVELPQAKSGPAGLAKSDRPNGSEQAELPVSIEGDPNFARNAVDEDMRTG